MDSQRSKIEKLGMKSSISKNLGLYVRTEKCLGTNDVIYSYIYLEIGSELAYLVMVISNMPTQIINE